MLLESNANRLSSLQNLINTAPPTLVRSSPSNLWGMELFANFKDDLNITQLIQESSAINGLSIWNVNASQVMKDGLSIPKRIKDYSASWFYEIRSALTSYVGIQRLGEQGMREGREDMFYSRAASFRQNTVGWHKDFFKSAENGRLWEYGVIIFDKKRQMGVLSISNPWYDDKYGSFAPWQIKLSDSESSHFVKRPEYMIDLTEMLEEVSGAPLSSPLERAFKSSDAQMWWGEAMNFNKILNWSAWEEYKKGHPLAFADSIMNQLNSQIPVMHLHNLVANAGKAHGYIINAYPDSLPGSVRLELQINPKNWFEINVKPKPQLKTDTPSNREIWRYNGDNDLLVNYDYESNNPKNFSFTVKLSPILGEDNVFGGSVGVQTLYVRRGVMHKSSKRRRDKIYVIGDLENGDYWTWDRAYYGKESKAMQKDDWLLIADLFNQARERAKVDSKTYYSREGKKTGYTQRTLKIFENTEQLLRQRMLDGGISKEDVDNLFS